MYVGAEHPQVTETYKDAINFRDTQVTLYTFTRKQRESQAIFSKSAATLKVLGDRHFNVDVEML